MHRNEWSRSSECARGVKLPSLHEPHRLIFPLADHSMALQAAQAVPVGNHRQFSPDHWQLAQERAQVAHEQRMREEAERQAEIDARPGVKWWKEKPPPERVA